MSGEPLDGSIRVSSAPVPLLTLLDPLKKPFREHRKLLLLTIFAGWGKFFLPLVLPQCTQRVLDSLLGNHGRLQADVLHDLRLLGIIALGAIIVSGGAAYYRSSLAQRMSARIQHGLRRRLFTHLQRLSMAFFQRHHAGALGTRVSSDINLAGALIDKGIVQYAMDGVFFIIVIGLMFATHLTLTVVVLTMLIMTAVVLRHFTPRIRRGQKAVQEGQSGITGQAAELFAGITLVKAYSGERETGEVFRQRSEEVMSLQWENARLQGSFQGLAHTLLQTCLWSVVFIGGWFAIVHPDSLSKGELVKFILLVGMVTSSMQRMVDAMLVVQDGFAALERINDILSVLPTPADAPDAGTPELHGGMELSHVTFAYRDRPVICDFSFIFAAGRSYVLVGASGSGKSSMAQLMLRFWDPQQGAVLMDGHDLRSIKQQHFRTHVAIVQQEAIIFSSSVHDNIDFGIDHARREDVIAAAQAAQAHAFLGQRGVAGRVVLMH